MRGAVHPVPGVPPELRRVIYTTNSIESLNYQLRKVTKNRGHFLNDQAAVKLLWMAICNIEDKRPANETKRKDCRRRPPSRRPTRRRRRHHQLETSLGATLTDLSRTNQPIPVNRTPVRLTQQT